MVDVEDQSEVERVGAGGQGFVQDAVAPDVSEGDAAQLVLVEIVRGDWVSSANASFDAPSCLPASRSDSAGSNFQCSIRSGKFPGARHGPTSFRRSTNDDHPGA